MANSLSEEKKIKCDVCNKYFNPEEIEECDSCHRKYCPRDKGRENECWWCYNDRVLQSD
jgi:hypothetical protein